MQTLKVRAGVIIGALSAFMSGVVLSQDNHDRFIHSGTIQNEALPRSTTRTEAPTGFDNLINGVSPQGPEYE